VWLKGNLLVVQRLLSASHGVLLQPFLAWQRVDDGIEDDERI
jgi:hypothetical protein